MQIKKPMRGGDSHLSICKMEHLGNAKASSKCTEQVTKSVKEKPMRIKKPMRCGDSYLSICKIEQLANVKAKCKINKASAKK